MKLFGITILHRSIVNWSGGGHVFSVYVHSLICETDLVHWYSTDLLSITVGGRCILCICACCNMGNLFGVLIFHRFIFNWSGGVVVSSVYVHSAICKTYLV